jgi:oxepin-CoA hydrolase/3-oxo-5,6-dehydrosuberyl-CoA semialdehyde dehydrogenase
VSNGQQNLSGWFEGTALALLGLDRLRFTVPVKFGDTIHTEMTVKQARESGKGDRGVVTFDVVVKNQRDEIVCTYEENVLMRRRG